MESGQADKSAEPRISIIIPAHNASNYLEQALPAIRRSSYTDFEVIVVDDHSTDGTGDVARRYCDRVVVNEATAGQGTARNLGVEHARGEILLFLDADVCVHEGTIQLVADAFDLHPDVAAVFGSYDDEPADRSVVSSFKNLFHHFVHQNSSPEASTFWTGCGAIRREVFKRVGGFWNPGLTQIEDIEYGYRLREAGEKILLDPKIQVKHLKCWSLRALVYTDVFRRGIPWTIMIMNRGQNERELNFSAGQKLCAPLACMIVPALIAALLHGRGPANPWLMVPVLLVVVVALLNAQFLALLCRKRGPLFALACLPLLLLYYHYSMFGLLTGLMLYVSGKRPCPQK